MRRRIKICHVIGDFVNGGVEAIIYNYFSNMNLEEFEVHIIGHGVKVQECARRFEDLGFIIHNITPKRESLIRNLLEMKKIFERYQFDIVHSHLTEWACVPMLLAWQSGIKIRINHSHMAEKPQGLKNKIYYGLRLWIGKLFATDYFACGRDAGIYLFGKRIIEEKKVVILPNSIDVERFSFNAKLRKEIRDRYRIKDSETVIGNVGRFFEQKNHALLIDIFARYYKQHPNSVLLLVGDGELLDTIKEKVEVMHLSHAVKFLGVCENVYELYQAMDIFVLPSLYEGFPVVGVEAQVSGLPCLFSKQITDEIAISDDVVFVDLNADKNEWIQGMKMLLNKTSRGNTRCEFERFDIYKNAVKLEEFYKKKVL